MLLKAGANPNAKAPDGITLLHQAAQAANLDMIRALAEANVKFDEPNKDGLTALDVAEGKQPAGLLPPAEHAVVVGSTRRWRRSWPRWTRRWNNSAGCRKAASRIDGSAAGAARTCGTGSVDGFRTCSRWRRAMRKGFFAATALMLLHRCRPVTAQQTPTEGRRSATARMDPATARGRANAGTPIRRC